MELEKIIQILNKNINEIKKLNWLFSKNELGLIEEIENELYAEYKKNGLSIVFIGGKSVSFFLYSEGVDGYAGFNGDIGLPINFKMSCDKVRDVLGQPQEFNSEIKKSEIQGDIPIWDRYDFDKYSIHVQYRNDMKNIELITVMDASVVPNKRGRRQCH